MDSIRHYIFPFIRKKIKKIKQNKNKETFFMHSYRTCMKHILYMLSYRVSDCYSNISQVLPPQHTPVASD